MSRRFQNHANAQNSMLSGWFKLGNESRFIFIRIFLLKAPNIDFSALKHLSWESYIVHKDDRSTSSRSKHNIPMNHKIAFKQIKVSSDLFVSQYLLGGLPCITLFRLGRATEIWQPSSQGKILSTSPQMQPCSWPGPRPTLPRCGDTLSGRGRTHFRDPCSILKSFPMSGLKAFHRNFTIGKDWNASAGWGNLLECHQSTRVNNWTFCLDYRSWR